MIPIRFAGQLSCGVVLIAAALAGCTVDHVGAAVPQSAVPSKTSANSAPGPGRPREVKINSVRPCELFTEENRREFKIDRPFAEEKDIFFGSQVCDFLGRAEKVTISVNMLLDRDMDAFAPGKTPAHTRSIRVQGFSAYEAYVDGRPGNLACGVNVGVAQGQVLRVQATEQGRYENPLTQEEVCRRATRGAELALGNLLARG
ncbi:DUF3558 domain-containing protein [Allokutzneria sp. A3M-2-11 16]|uniref:DUF3558 domain-containing protein n=1 Tax=Allokutzneria sp. A3M-2-11 16 TaxID=2962043 RepID=UPI0020B78064|nr:DUF3558 domain-containing protein [Allokutzneria sp. A3M-2-11 16]MCP3798026.1 DUF3558 domain-containing protein [Allokutzneria sp. A3M-2-11 16]